MSAVRGGAIVAGVAAGLLGAGLLAIGVPHALGDRSAYARARRCGERITLDCLREIPARVDHVYTTWRPLVSDHVVVESRGINDLDGIQVDVRVPGDNAVFHRLGRRDDVVVEVFRGRIVRIYHATGSLETMVAPRWQAAGRLAIGTVLLGFGALLVGAFTSRRRRPLYASRGFGLVTVTVTAGGAGMGVAVYVFNVAELGTVMLGGVIAATFIAVAAVAERRRFARCNDQARC